MAIEAIAVVLVPLCLLLSHWLGLDTLLLAWLFEVTEKEFDDPCTTSFGNTSAALPRFFLHPSCFRGAWAHMSNEMLRCHSSRVSTEEEADIVLVSIPNRLREIDFFQLARMRWLAALPTRLAEKPYVVWIHGLQLDHCLAAQLEDPLCAEVSAVLNREDLVFASYDLRDHVLCANTAETLRGITFAPENFFRRESPVAADLNFSVGKKLLNFRGDGNSGFFGSSTARPDLKAAFAQFNDSKIVVEFAKPPYSNYDRERYDDLLLSSVFSLVPHGDGRWEGRFSEVMGACSIPVVMADGLTMPYEEIIDWSKASVRLEEALARKPSALLAELPQEPAVIEAMMREVCYLNTQFFASAEKRFDAMLLSVKAYIPRRPSPRCSGASCGHFRWKVDRERLEEARGCSELAWRRKGASSPFWYRVRQQVAIGLLQR